MANVTPPLSLWNVIPLRHDGILRVQVTYRPGRLADPFGDSEAAEHLLETATESAKNHVEELNEVLDMLEETDGASDHARTDYGAELRLDFGGTEVAVKISVQVPGLLMPNGQLIFRLHEALSGVLGCQWHTADPEGFEAEAVSDDEPDDELPLHLQFIPAVDETDVGAN